VEDFIDFLLSRGPHHESGERILDSSEIAHDVVLSPQQAVEGDEVSPPRTPSHERGELLRGYETCDEGFFMGYENHRAQPVPDKGRVVRKDEEKSRQILEWIE